MPERKRSLTQNGGFGRVLTAMVTPFDSNGAVDIEAARTLARHLIDHGSDGLVVVGTTGESPTLKDSEKRALIEAVAEVCSGRASVVAGSSTYDTEHSVSLSRDAAASGADALMAVTPYYSRPSQAGIASHFKAIAESTDLPVILYNIPGRTGTLIEVETVIELSTHPNIVGIKDATGNLAMTSRVVAETPEDFSVYSGDDVLTLPMLAVGGVGVISVASHVAGTLISEMIEAFTAGNVGEARATHLRLLKLFSLLFAEPNPGPVKAACEIMGFTVGPPRLPMQAASEDLAVKLRDELARLDLISEP
ncbi:MAG: 4-hydroxy-tetrahydrodipicolinate synthase [Acidobacteria bacterium]|nr:MAG: 4-hydroxy-tetrahydrodipicolinate synthase [Acidobacteriota bacterium]